MNVIKAMDKMSSIDGNISELLLLRDKIETAASPKVVFGDLDGDGAEKLAALNEKYFKLLKICRIEPGETDTKKIQLASQTSALVSECYRRAQTSISQNIYDKEDKVGAPQQDEIIAILESNTNRYLLHEVLGEGIVAIVYRATFIDGNGTRQSVCLKVSKDTNDNELLKNEINLLNELNHVSLPKAIEAFELGDGRQVNVLSLANGYTFEQLRNNSTHESGIIEPDYHIGWILERTLAVLGYLHAKGIVHGNVQPVHLVVQPEMHNVMLVDLCWAVKKGNNSSYIQVGTDYYSSPEVFNKEQPHPAMDIYGLGRSIIYLAGGDPEDASIPGTLNNMYSKLLARMSESNLDLRAKDAYQLAHHVVVIREELFGKDRTFKPLPVSEEAKI